MFLFINKDNQTETTFTVVINNSSYTFNKDLHKNTKDQLRLLAEHMGYGDGYASTKMLRGYIKRRLSFRTMEEAYERWPILCKSVLKDELEDYYDQIKDLTVDEEFAVCHFKVTQENYDRLCAE
jgi:hypothetical protein